MDRVYESGAVAGAPAAPAAPSTGYPTNGNPVAGIEATWPGAYWFHMITEELRAVITAAGLVPDHTNLGQLLAALQGGFGLSKSLAAEGWVTLPGGLIIQWGAWMSHATAGAPVLVIWPLAWPGGVLSMSAAAGGGTSTVTSAWTDTFTSTSFNGRSNVASQTMRYIAVGF